MQQQVSLSEHTSRVLAHIRAPTVQCPWTFANQLWDTPDAELGLGASDHGFLLTSDHENSPGR